MGKIVHKLNLNKTPQLVESNSIIYAKNIKLLKDQTIGADTAISLEDELNNIDSSAEIISIIVGVNTKLYVFVKTNNSASIYEYDEQNGNLNQIKSAWKYSGGIIEGYTTINHTGEVILTICEYKEDNSLLVPIKHININKSSELDDESIYTQSPNIPITNLLLQNTYTQTIPNGVYQFFIRYKIRDNFYTNWFPCSKELFAGTRHILKTIQGETKYVNTRTDAGKSFVFQVQHLFGPKNVDGIDYSKSFQEYQLGFILAHDDSTVARSWKSFSFEEDVIYFDYDKRSINEIDIDDLLKVTYDIYNVKNLTYFKNKLYVSNYKETDFNPTLHQYANKINIELVQKNIELSNNPYIDNIQLIRKDNTLPEGVYDYIGGDPIKKLVGSKYNNDNTLDTNTISCDSTKTDKGIYEAHLHYSGIKPSVYFIAKAYDYSENKKFYLPEVDLNLNWKTANVFTNKGNNCYTTKPANDTACHPWEKYDGLAGYWYLASAANNGSKYHIRNYAKDGMQIYDASLMDSVYSVGEFEIKSALSRALPKQYVYVGCYITSNNTKYYITGKEQEFEEDKLKNPLYIPNGQTAYTIKELENTAKYHVLSKICGIDSSGVFYAKLNNSVVPISSYTILYHTFSFDTSVTGTLPIQYGGKARIMRVDITKETTLTTKSCCIFPKYISNIRKYKQHRTLMPFTEYEFYIHYITTNGINTNGYLIGRNSIESFDLKSTHNIIYPVFNNITIPDNYCGCFISIYKASNDVAQLFNITHKGITFNADCLELDSLLYNLNDNITIINSIGTVITAKATYHSSSSTEPINMLGNCGTITWEATGKESINLYDSIVKTPITFTATSIYDTCYFTIRIKGEQDTGDNTFNYSISTHERFDFTNLINKYPAVVVEASYNLGTNSTGVEIQIPEPNTVSKIQIVLADGTNTFINTTDSTTIKDVAEQFNKFFNSYFDKSEYKIVEDVVIPQITFNIVNNKKEVSWKTVVTAKNGTESREDNSGTIAMTHWQSVTLKVSTKVNNITSLGIGCDTTFEQAYDKAVKNSESANILSNSNTYWIKINTKTQNDTNKQLIKLTPYLSKDSLVNGKYDNDEYLNSPGYFNNVKKLNREINNELYISGSDIYKKNIDSASASTLTLDTYSDSVKLSSSTEYNVLSNFNLTYLSITEDIVPQIRTYKDATGTKSKEVIQSIDSLINSFILELQSMYKEYTRKYYRVYEANTITDFDNTIRASDTNTDELYRNIYRFDATNYYNVPVNRGDIIRMFSINNFIYVHTEHALYSFSGNNSLNTTEGEVNLKENNVFETGISELFDAEHGYAGLQKKNHALVCFKKYVFYDAIAKTLYGFEGNGNLVALSDAINKLLEYINPTDVLFAGDTYNDRFFVNFISDKGNVCLSYNFKTNTFVSLHDFTFDAAYSSRVNTYFTLNDKQQNIYKFNHNAINDYSDLYKPSLITIPDNNSATTVESCIDIIYNDYYEQIKVLNWINWISSKIEAYHQSDNNNCAEEVLDKYAGTKIRIYSDQCSTDLINLTDSNNKPLIQNEQDITTDKSYSYPRYNCGIWSLNYFRDIKNVEDIYNYGNLQSIQDRSLIYGKYFVVRLIYKGVNFKLENIKFNIEDYEKV